MDIRLYSLIGITLTISWAYCCVAKVTQQHAIVEYFDKQYVSEARAFTRRQKRGDYYLTNFTVVTRVIIDNSITIKLAADFKSIGNIVFHERRVCDSFEVFWLREYAYTHSNVSQCPIPVGRYQFLNMEFPPKYFPVSVPKGEGTLHIYYYTTHSKRIVFHALVKILSS